MRLVIFAWAFAAAWFVVFYIAVRDVSLVRISMTLPVFWALIISFRWVLNGIDDTKRRPRETGREAANLDRPPAQARGWWRRWRR
jgi:hypothetical protein